MLDSVQTSVLYSDVFNRILPQSMLSPYDQYCSHSNYNSEQSQGSSNNYQGYAHIDDPSVTVTACVKIYINVINTYSIKFYIDITVIMKGIQLQGRRRLYDWYSERRISF